MDVLLHDVMIEPVGFCNLHCKMCYTKQSSAVLDPAIIEHFIRGYLDALPGPLRLYWIGRGEVTLYKHLAPLVNLFSEVYPDRVSHLIQTNGIKIAEAMQQVRRLDNVDVSVSLDGFEETNDANRGKGTFEVIVSNIKQLVAMGVRTRVQAILTPALVKRALEFETFVHGIAPGSNVQYLYPVTREDFEHANKETIIDPVLSRHDLAQVDEALDASAMASIRASIDRLWRTRYVSISCDGIVYNCCEFQVKIGMLDTCMATIIDRVKDDNACKPCSLRKLCFPDHDLPASNPVHA